MTYTIRVMSRADLLRAIDWAAAEGWNPGRHDAAPFQAADPRGFLVGLLDGVPVASISVVRYADTFGFLGLYIVEPGQRGRGLGLRLWQAGLAHLEGCTVGLDGVVAQQANYQKSAFVYAYPNYRFGGRVEPHADPALVDARDLPLDRLLAFDRGLFPAPRDAFLTAWLGMPESRSLALIEDGGITGFGTIRRSRQGWKVGPLHAPGAGAAERLLRALAATAGEDELFLDIPGPNAPGLAMAEHLGLAMVFETARMYRGPAPELPLQRLFGVTTFELG
jgi:hypothetical protein